MKRHVDVKFVLFNRIDFSSLKSTSEYWGLVLIRFFSMATSTLILSGYLYGYLDSVTHNILGQLEPIFLTLTSLFLSFVALTFMYVVIIYGLCTIASIILSGDFRERNGFIFLGNKSM